MTYSILIVNYNSWSLLTKCLTALSAQTFKDFEVLVIDNASAEPPPAGLLSSLPRLRFFQNEVNTGFAQANNRLIEELSDDSWAVLLNPDTSAHPEWLASLVAASLAHPAYSLFSSHLLMTSDTDLLDGDGDSYQVSGLAWQNGHGQRVQAALVAEVFSPSAAAAMIQVSMIRAIGGFDEDFFCYVEDVDLGLRLRLAGEKCLFIPEAVVEHVGSATTGGRRSDFVVYHGHRNLVWCYVKNVPLSLLLATLPLHILLNVFSLAGC